MKTKPATRHSSSHLLGAVLAALAISLSAAHATTLAYDPFATSENYSATAGGDSLGRIPNQTGLSTANGLAATWTTVSGLPGNYLYRAAASMTYPGLTTSGNGGIQFTPLDDTFRNGRRDTTSTIATASYGSLYMSFLLRTPANLDANGSASVFFNVNTANTTGFGAGIAAGNLAMQWRDSGGGLNYLSLGTAWAADTTYLFVVKAFENAADWGGTGDSQQVWVNPTDFTSEATLTSSALASGLKADTFAVANSAALGGFSVQSANLSGAGVMYFDEFRFGTTLADVLPVTPVPEPSTMALLGLGISAVAFLRRRK